VGAPLGRRLLLAKGMSSGCRGVKQFFVCGEQGDYMDATQERKKERVNIRVKKEMMAKS